MAHLQVIVHFRQGKKSISNKPTFCMSNCIHPGIALGISQVLIFFKRKILCILTQKNFTAAYIFSHRKMDLKASTFFIFLLSLLSMLIGTASPAWLPVLFCHTIKLLFFSSPASFQSSNCQHLAIYHHLTVHVQTRSHSYSSFSPQLFFPFPSAGVHTTRFPFSLPIFPSSYISSFYFLLFCPGTQKVRTVLCIWTTLYKKKDLLQPSCFLFLQPLPFPYFLSSENSVLSTSFAHFSLSEFEVCSAGKTPLLLAVVLSARVPLVPVTAITRKVLSSHFSLRGSIQCAVQLKQSAFKGRGCVCKVLANTDPTFRRVSIIQCTPE